MFTHTPGVALPGAYAQPLLPSINTFAPVALPSGTSAPAAAVVAPGAPRIFVTEMQRHMMYVQTHPHPQPAPAAAAAPARAPGGAVAITAPQVFQSVPQSAAPTPSFQQQQPPQGAGGVDPSRAVLAAAIAAQQQQQQQQFAAGSHSLRRVTMRAQVQQMQSQMIASNTGLGPGMMRGRRAVLQQHLVPIAAGPQVVTPLSRPRASRGGENNPWAKKQVLEITPEDFPFISAVQTLVTSFVLPHGQCGVLHLPFLLSPEVANAVRSQTLQVRLCASKNKDGKCVFIGACPVSFAINTAPCVAPAPSSNPREAFKTLDVVYGINVSDKVVQGNNDLQIATTRCCCAFSFRLVVVKAVRFEEIIQRTVERQCLDESAARDKLLSFFSGGRSPDAACAEPDEDEPMVLMSALPLRCPLSLVRIGTPVRTVKCRHLQCFDLGTYLQFNQSHPRFLCPVCGASAKYTELIVDPFVQSVLRNAPKDCDEVVVHPDCSWEPASAAGRIGSDDEQDEQGIKREAADDGSGPASPNKRVAWTPSPPSTPTPQQQQVSAAAVAASATVPPSPPATLVAAGSGTPTQQGSALVAPDTPVLVGRSFDSIRPIMLPPQLGMQQAPPSQQRGGQMQPHGRHRGAPEVIVLDD